MGVSVPDAVVTGAGVLVLLEFCEDKEDSICRQNGMVVVEK